MQYSVGSSIDLCLKLNGEKKTEEELLCSACLSPMDKAAHRRTMSKTIGCEDEHVLAEGRRGRLREDRQE